MDGPPAGKRLKCIRGKLRPEPDTRRLKSKLVGLKGGGIVTFLDRIGDLFPGRRLPWPGWRVLLHHHFASRFHDQFIMRFLHGEETQVVSEVIHSLGDRRRMWLYA